MSNKAVVLFTNFFDATYLIRSGILLFEDQGQSYSYPIIDRKSGITIDKNYCAHSIALSQPNKDEQLPRLDFFCPTYDMLLRYKKNKDWVAYEKDYRKILKDRKVKIKTGMNSLDEDTLYILCCWENTSRGAHCHRQIIYDAMCNSKVARKKVIPVYRDGSKKVKSYGHEVIDASSPRPRRRGNRNVDGREAIGSIIESFFDGISPLAGITQPPNDPNADTYNDYNDDIPF